MEITPSDFFQTLGHPQRIEVFRLLIRRYPDALPAGEIGAVLGLKPSTLSVYLKALMRAGLLQQNRRGTSLHYQARIETMQNALTFLMDDCCKGRADFCGPQALSAPKARFNVLFLCTGNAARSLMAESMLRHFAGERFAAYSAGTYPATAPNKRAIALLRGRGYDTSLLRSKSTDEYLASDAPQMDFVFTLCDHAANEDCSVWQGQPVSSHWGLPDPAEADGSQKEIAGAFETAFEKIHSRISTFVSLPLETLDRRSQQKALDSIALS